MEPHHDGTPHWHLLLFFDPKHLTQITDVFREHMMRESPDEPGANKHRVTVVTIDPTRGSATGYVAKYMSKNIDGYGVDRDAEDFVEGRPANETVIRIEAWASLWGIRQFQQIGGPPVGIWRELRRVNESLVGEIETARHAADSGNWFTYMKVMSRCADSPDGQLIKLAREWIDEVGAYGEQIGFKTIGVEYNGTTIVTRLQEWIVMHDPIFATSRFLFRQLYIFG